MGEFCLKEWIEQLLAEDIGTVVLNEPLSRHTSWKIGGPVDAYIEPRNKEILGAVIKLLANYKIPWKIIGKGSNLLVLDGGYRGAIISLKEKQFHQITYHDSTIQVGAGFSIIRLANLAAKQGLTGLEFAGGIPGTVGGAIYMNAGAHGSDVSRVLKEAEVLLENGEVEFWDNKAFHFMYRTSALQQKKGIILTATFQLEPGNRKEIATAMASYKDRRIKSQPFTLPCSGSVFRNPEGDYAGRLIEELGLKGYKIGDAQISTMHANFIVNMGKAKARDILAIIQYIKEKVYENYHIALETEVEVIGER